MEVFYVMVLVLVAGAVPSRGRTESVGTVFNKTQPHESMNNVPVSSRTTIPFKRMYLVMQWPKSFCNTIGNRHCHQPVPPRFTVHGLWPQTVLPRNDCRKLLHQYPPFNNGQLDPKLRDPLEGHWPNLTSVDNEHYFWQHEYNKHGSCTFNDQNRFFLLTLQMVERLEQPRLDRGKNIFHDKPEWISNVEAAVRGVTKKIPQLNCSYIGKSRILQLDWIRLCYDSPINGARLTDCAPRSNCGNGWVNLPRP